MAVTCTFNWFFKFRGRLWSRIRLPGERVLIVLLRIVEPAGRRSVRCGQGRGGEGEKGTETEDYGKDLFQNSSFLRSLEILALLVELVLGVSPGQEPRPKPKISLITRMETEARKKPTHI